MKRLILLFTAITVLVSCAQTTPEMDERYCLANSNFKAKERVYKNCMAQIKQSKKSRNKTAENFIEALFDVIIEQ